MENSLEGTKKLLNRETLYELFKNGKRPTQEDFADLIFSMINKLDDGISKDLDHGLELAPQGTSAEQLLSFYHRIDDLGPAWTVGLSAPEDGGGLNMENGTTKQSALYIDAAGRVGIGTKQPKTALDVQGMLAAKAIVGTYAQGTVAANGQWHTIIKDMEGCNMFNIVACANGQQGEGKYVLMNATAINAYSGKSGVIKKQQDRYGWQWWRRLQLRWTGTPFKYNLELRTRSDFGEKGVITYRMIQLWENQLPKRTVAEI
jgi:hypothetical protein